AGVRAVARLARAVVHLVLRHVRAGAHGARDVAGQTGARARRVAADAIDAVTGGALAADGAGHAVRLPAAPAPVARARAGARGDRVGVRLALRHVRARADGAGHAAGLARPRAGEVAADAVGAEPARAVPVHGARL